MRGSLRSRCPFQGTQGPTAGVARTVVASVQSAHLILFVAQIAWPHGFAQLYGSLLNALEPLFVRCDFYHLHLRRSYPILNFCTRMRFEYHG